MLKKRGKDLTEDALKCSIGKPPLDAWQATIDCVGLAGVSATDLYAESEAELTEHWHEATYMPGALRLIRHLQSDPTLKIGLATSTPRAVLAKKIANKPLLQQVFQAIVCGDDDDLLRKGKPNPACFAKVCKLLDVTPESTLVFEDAPSGLLAAIDAGCRVVYVPSIVDDMTLDDDERADRIQRRKTLLDFDPTTFSLPGFRDSIEGTIPLHDPESVIRIRGNVVKGFGRGSKTLGIPTANVDTVALARVVPGATTGIFYGWASLDAYPGAVYATALSIGWNPYFSDSTEKTCEPWILHDFGEGANFCGTGISLVILGFIRPESAEFSSLEALVQRIREDGNVTRRVLQTEDMMRWREDPFLRSGVDASAGAF